MIPIVYTLAAFGFAFIIGFSKISLPFRQWLSNNIEQQDCPVGEACTRLELRPAQRICRWLLALLECPACLGFWTGLLCTVVGHLGLAAAFGLFGWPLWLAAFFLALYTSATNFIIGAITRLIEV
jgi:hypothetical protein